MYCFEHICIKCMQEISDMFKSKTENKIVACEHIEQKTHYSVCMSMCVWCTCIYSRRQAFSPWPRLQSFGQLPAAWLHKGTEPHTEPKRKHNHFGTSSLETSFVTKFNINMHSHYLLEAVSHPRLEAQSPGSAGYKHLRVGHPDI